MGDTTRLERWVALQQKTWDVDSGSKASRIAVERPGGELIQSFSADLAELGRVLQDCLDMQAAELPRGSSHQFKIIAYDHCNKQIAELPQTMQGLSKEASSATQQHLQQARAHHMDVDTMAFVQDKTRSELEQLHNRFTDLFDDATALAESNALMRLNNEQLLLSRLKFERQMARADKIFQAMGELMIPVGTILLEKYGPKLLGTKPGEMLSKVSKALEKLDEKPPESAPTIQGSTINGESAPSSSKPVDTIVPVVPEPRQGTLSRNAQGRGTGNRGHLPRKCGPKAPRTQTTKRK